MNTQQLLARFQLSAPVQQHDLRSTKLSASKRASAVILPLIDINNHAHILLCKRPAHLKYHPSEICLPGGKHERKDKTLRDTALRELKEELNITSVDVTIHGKLANYSTLTGFTITPYVGLLAANTHWQADQNEVAASFLLPISALIDANNWQPLLFTYQGRTITLHGFSTHYGLLWGATANIIKNFTKQLLLPV